MKKIVFVTGNVGKVESAKKYFDGTDVELEWFKYDAVEPEINDIEFIAKTKVISAYQMVQVPCIALDAGFYINAFPGQPGFPGAFPKRELLDKMGIEKLLTIMSNVEDKSCYFLECLAYYDGQTLKYFYGESKGTLSENIKGPNREDKWSDLWSIFIPQNHIHTLSEMDEQERSHRIDNHTSALHEFAKYCKEEVTLKYKK